MTETVKFLHIVTAALWLGGGVMLTVLQIELMRGGNQPAMGAVGAAAIKFSRTYFMPVALATLGFGIWTAYAGDWDFAAAWISIGFTVVVINAILAMAVIGPTGRKLGAAMADGDLAAVPALRRRLGAATTTANVLLLIAFWAMVAKP